MEFKLGIDLPGGNKKNEVDSNNASEGSEHSERWEFYANYCEDKDIELSIYLYAELEEVLYRHYIENGQWIIEFAEERDIPIVFDINRLEESDYKDNIHLNPQGQNVMAGIFEPEVKVYFSE